MRSIKSIAAALVVASLAACGGGGGGSSGSGASGGGGGGGGGTLLPMYVSGNVTGMGSGTLSGTLTLSNGTTTVTVIGNTGFQFPDPVAVGSKYAVTVVLPQPTGLTCTVANGSGTVSANGVPTINVGCQVSPPAPTSKTYPAFVPSFPLAAAPQLPAVIIAHPKIIPVFFSDSPDQANTMTFLGQLATSTEWATLSQYGVSAPTIGTPVHLSTAAPASTNNAAITAFVAANANAWSSLTGSEMFVLYYPATTTMTDKLGAGYHLVATVSSSSVPFTVLPNYVSANNDGYLQFHELAEMATDPTGRGFFELNHDFDPWIGVSGSELGDLCVNNDFFPSTDIPASGGMKNIWSNTLAAAGKDPCGTPVASGALTAQTTVFPWFGAFPVLSGTYHQTTGYTNPAVTDNNASQVIVSGTSGVVELKAFSYAELPGPMTLAVYQTGGGIIVGGKTSPVITFSLDKTVVTNGDIANLTITVPPLDPVHNLVAVAYTFVVVATVTDLQGQTHVRAFPGLITP